MARCSPAWAPEEIEGVNKIGDKEGCHTCGAETPGTKKGNWVKDHQPPSALAKPGENQRLYPQCIDCSNKQGGDVRAAKAKEHAKMDAEALKAREQEPTGPAYSSAKPSTPSAPLIGGTPQINAPPPIDEERAPWVQ